MLTCQIRYIIADSKTAPLMMLSFMVSMLLAMRVSELACWPEMRRYLPSRSLPIILISRTIIMGAEYSTSSGVMIFSTDSIKIWMPTMMIIQAISRAPKCSIFS